MDSDSGQSSSDPLNEPAITTMNPTPLRECKAQNRTQEMKALAPEMFNELVVSHISRRLDLYDGKLDELINGISKRKSSVVGIKKSHFKKITSPFLTKKTRLGCEKEATSTTKSTVSSVVVDAICRLIVSLSSPSELREEGLFRKSGNCTRVKELKQKLVGDSDIDLTPYTVHDRATVIKNLLSEISEPLLLEQHIEAFRQAVALEGNGVETADQRCLRVIQLLILHLPQNNVLILQHLLSLLHAVAEEAANKMDSNGLATLFAPHLLCSKHLVSDHAMFNSALKPAVRAVEFMIKYSAKIFLIPPELIRDVDHFFQMEERLSGESCGQRTPVRRPCVAEGTPVTTSLTFSSRSTENINMTNSELAKLHSHVQSLPESERRRLSKQLVDATVLNVPPSTPSSVLLETPRKHARSKSLGSSLKKHLPMFKNKTKHPTVSEDELGPTVLTVMNIDFDIPPGGDVVIDCKLQLQTTKKRTAADSHKRTPLPRSQDCLRRFSDGDITPPKVAHREPEKVRSPRHASPAKDCKRILAPLCITENEKKHVPALDQQEKKLQRRLTPALQHEASVLPDLVTCDSQKSRKSRSREHQRPSQSAMNSPINRETAL